MRSHPSHAKLGRRRFLAGLAMGAAAATSPAFGAGKGLIGTAINHLSYQSADYRKTRDFYRDVLGFQVSDEDDQQLYLWAGNTLISAKNTPLVRSPWIDHWGVTVEPWDLNTIEAVLKERSLPARISRNDPHDPSGKSAFTRDPNGYTLQLCAKDLEAKPAPAATGAPLRAIGLHHVAYQCPDYKKPRDFYRELVGAAVSNDDGQQAHLVLGDAFLVVRTNPDSTAARPIEHIAWTLADWNVKRVAVELKRHGLDVRPDAAGKSIFSKDVNGYPLVLCDRN